MQITKIKRSKGLTTVSWETTQLGDTTAHTLTSSRAPTVGFLLAFDALAAYAREICEFSEDMSGELRMSGVTLTHGDDLGIVITCLRDVSGSEAPMVINTPHLLNEGWPAGLSTAVSRLQEQVMLFVAGQGDQRDMFEAKHEADAPATEVTVEFSASGAAV